MQVLEKKSQKNMSHNWFVCEMISDTQRNAVVYPMLPRSVDLRLPTSNLQLLTPHYYTVMSSASSPDSTAAYLQKSLRRIAATNHSYSSLLNAHAVTRYAVMPAPPATKICPTTARKVRNGINVPYSSLTA